MKPRYKYTVWADSESTISITPKHFNNVDAADSFASHFVHRYDGENAERVILHIEDNELDETIDTVENINKYDSYLFE